MVIVWVFFSKVKTHLWHTSLSPRTFSDTPLSSTGPLSFILLANTYKDCCGKHHFVTLYHQSWGFLLVIRVMIWMADNMSVIQRSLHLCKSISFLLCDPIKRCSVFRQIWPADLCARVPGQRGSRGLRHQRQDREESQTFKISSGTLLFQCRIQYAIVPKLVKLYWNDSNVKQWSMMQQMHQARAALRK